MKIILAAAGIALGVAALSLVTPRADHFRMLASQTPEDVKQYAPFDLRKATHEKYMIVGSCETSLAIIANALDGTSQLRGNEIAWLGNVVTQIARHEYGVGDNVGFYDFALPSTLRANHLWSIHHALQAPGPRTIIYVAGIEMIHMYDSDALGAVVASRVLERWRELYPDARPQIDRYDAYLRTLPAHAAARRRFGDNWDGLLDPETLLPSRWLSVESTGDALTMIHYVKRNISDWVNGPSVFASRMLQRFSRFDAVREQTLTRETFSRRQYAEATHQYLARYMTMVMTAPTEYLADGGEPMRLWYELAVRVTQSAGAKFAAYIPPHMEFSPEHYRDYFHPHFVQPLSRWLQAQNVSLIDNTVLPGAGFPDAVALLGCRPGDCVTSGFHFNLAGEFKQARLLIESLIQHNLLRAPPRASRAAARES